MPSIDDIRAAVAHTVPHYDIKEVYLYGSYARGEQTEQSDIDLRLLCGRDITFSELLDIQESLENKLGIDLDIATASPEQMRPSFYNRIKRDEVLLYVA